MVFLSNLFEDVRNQPIAICIISHLQYFDVQRLACTSPTFAKFLSIYHHETSIDHDSNADLKHIVYWLRDLEVLRSLGCSGYLYRKISRSIYHKTYRIMSFEEGAHDNPQVEEETTLFDIFETSFPYRFFGLTPNFQFSHVHPLDLEERELEIGEMFDDIYYDKETHTYLAPGDTSSYKGEGLECDHGHCQEEFVSRVFYVNGKAVCGKCIDEMCLLKLRFCAKFYKADNSSFEVKELEYGNKEEDSPSIISSNRRGLDAPSRWGLNEDEFWAQLWYSAPYNYGELRFIGTGQRGTNSKKKQEIGEENKDDIAERRRTALESIRKRRKIKQQERK
mmetsp:Transcript_7246/g.11026  ORF Transcript_7246/g.11026 Transcript_7246/m.11026 type:complete len:335 (-) Transcript_7246:39-1043(-)